jgi:hypothetical protein
VTNPARTFFIHATDPVTREAFYIEIIGDQLVTSHTVAVTTENITRLFALTHPPRRLPVVSAPGWAEIRKEWDDLRLERDEAPANAATMTGFLDA